jgi:hypothetical protein
MSKVRNLVGSGQFCPEEQAADGQARVASKKPDFLLNKEQGTLRTVPFIATIISEYKLLSATM